MDLRILRYFLAIVEEGSMNKAARTLHITQPTLSRQIAQFEEELGCPLFLRQSKSLHLTSQGLLLARRARELLELESRTLDEISSLHSELKGELLIGAGEMKAMQALLEIVRQFQVLYPGIQVSLITGTADQTMEMIENGLLDVGFFLKPFHFHDAVYRSWNYTEQWVAVMHKDHPLAARRSLHPKDLADEPLIMPYRKEARQHVVNWLGKPESELHIPLSSSMASNGAMMALNKMGVLMTIDGSLSNLHMDLKAIPLDPPLTTGLAIAWKERFPKPPVQEKFLEFLNDVLADELSEPRH